MVKAERASTRPGRERRIATPAGIPRHRTALYLVGRLRPSFFATVGPPFLIEARVGSRLCFLAYTVGLPPGCTLQPRHTSPRLTCISQHAKRWTYALVSKPGVPGWPFRFHFAESQDVPPLPRSGTPSRIVRPRPFSKQPSVHHGHTSSHID